MRLKKILPLFAFVCLFVQVGLSQNGKAENNVWTPKQANAWYKKQPWFVGPNFLPSTAINQLEMWQAETFDTLTINKELSLAQSIGMNAVRVFLHDIPHQQDATGFYNRINKFLEIANRHKIVANIFLLQVTQIRMYKFALIQEVVVIVGVGVVSFGGVGIRHAATISGSHLHIEAAVCQ